MKKILLFFATLSLLSCENIGELGKTEKCPAPEIDEIAVYEVTDTSARVGFSYTSDCDEAYGMVCVSESSEPTVEDRCVTGTSEIFIIDGLQPSTTYYVRSCVSQDGDGYYYYGTQTSFTTDKERPKVYALSVIGEQENSVLVEYNVSGPEVKSSGVCWSTEQNPTVEDAFKEGEPVTEGEMSAGVMTAGVVSDYDDSADEEATPDTDDEDRPEEGGEDRPGEGTSLRRVLLSELTEGETYHIRAYVEAEDGRVFYSSDELSVSAGEVVTPVFYVADKKAQDVVATVTYSIEIPEQSGMRLVEGGICWAADPDEPTIESDKLVYEAGEDGMCTAQISGLTPETSYIFRIYAVVSKVNMAGEEYTETFYSLHDYFSTYEKNEFFDIPDENFRARLVELCDEDGDGKVSVREARMRSKFEEADLKGHNIASLQGIEYFTNLTILDCSENSLTSLDLSGNTSLQYLRCHTNSLTSLDVSSCPGLKILDCSKNKITSLDLSGCAELSWVDCYENKLLTLDVRGCKTLTDINAPHNKLSSLDLSDTPALESLYIGDNEIESLDLSAVPSLKELVCFDNPITSLDLSACREIVDLSCRETSLRSIQMPYADKLEDFDAGLAYDLEEMTLGKTPSLKTFCADRTKLRKLDLSGSAVLERLELRQVSTLEELNISGCALLKDVWCFECALTALDASGLGTLTFLNCSDNKLTELNVAGDEMLEELYCQNNAITKLDVSDCTMLERLSCQNNGITELDLTNNKFIEDDYLHVDDGVKVTR